MIRRIGSGKPLALRQHSRRSGRGERTLLFAAVHESLLARGKDLPAVLTHVRCWRYAGKHMLNAGFALRRPERPCEPDPGGSTGHVRRLPLPNATRSCCSAMDARVKPAH